MDKKIELPALVFIEHPEMKDRTLILQTIAPFIVGQVWRFNTSDAFDRFVESMKSKRETDNVAISLIDGYNIAITIMQALPGGSMIPIVYNDFAELSDDMADFYKVYRIVPNEKYFKRYARN